MRVTLDLAPTVTMCFSSYFLNRRTAPVRRSFRLAFRPDPEGDTTHSLDPEWPSRTEFTAIGGPHGDLESSSSSALLDRSVYLILV